MQPGGDHGLAVPLMLGSAQGGVEISRYAQNRPAANGIVWDIKNLAAFSGLAQNNFNSITLDGGTPINLGNSIVTVNPAALMFQDPGGGSATVRQKWNIIPALFTQPGTAY